MTVCLLDCYDACSVDYANSTLKPGSDYFTASKLCANLFNILTHTQENLLLPHIDQQKVSINKALQAFEALLKSTEPKKILLYTGSGNVGVMQQVLHEAFCRIHATVAVGSLCDGAGQEGIKAARGVNIQPTLNDIQNSDVVVVWGRNIEHTNRHLLPFIKNKKLIVIDPRKTKLTQKADLHIQIKPRGDFYLAILLARFAHMQELFDEAYIAQYSENFEDFYDLFRSIGIKKAMDKCDVLPSEIYAFLSLVAGKKTTYIVGRSVQMYSIGTSVLHAIESVSFMLGHTTPTKSAVHFLGDSSVGLTSYFIPPTRTVSKVDVDFSAFDVVLFANSNALRQMPNTNKVEHDLHNCNVVYFGLHDNATAKRADIIIPALNFLSKTDIRASYMSHEVKLAPNIVKPIDEAISEYDLAQAILKAFDAQPLDSEDEIVSHYTKQLNHESQNIYFKTIPQHDFAQEPFVFIDEYYDNFTQEGFYLLTPKHNNSINSQGICDDEIYMHPDAGFKEGARVRISSYYGEVETIVHHDDTLHKECVCMYANNTLVNRLTSNKRVLEANSAQFQEISLKVIPL